MVFLWSLQEAFNKKLAAYIVKGEDTESISSLMKHFSVGSIAAADLASISDLFNKFEENLSELSEVEMVDLTVDDDAQEALKKSLAKLLLNEDERRVYESDALLERNKLDQELLEASRITDELRKENENLKNLQSVCEQQMESLMVVQKKRKEEKTSFDLFGKLPKKEVQYQSGDQSRSYKVHVLEDEKREDELKKEKRLKDMEIKEFKRKRKDEKNESIKRRKLAPSLSDELKNVDRNRKSMKLTEALYLPSKAHGSTSCSEEACKKRQIENYRLKDVDSKITIAAALAYRQLLCTRAFCKFTQLFLVNGDFKSNKKLYTFIYQLLPRFISVFDQCTGDMGAVKDLLAVREEKAWNLFKTVIPGQQLAYLYCQDLLVKSGIYAEDLNLCRKCDKSIAGHPPKTCGLVKQELNQLFNRKRAEFLESYRNQELAFDKSPKKMGISLKKKF